MHEAFSYCAQLVREHDKDRFLASLFAPRDQRQALFALYAFDIEAARIALIARQPLAGEVRLQWWREVLAGDRIEEARASPVAAALCAVLRGNRERIAPLEAMLEARRADLYDEPIRTLTDLEQYADDVAAPIMRVAILLLCGDAGGDAQQFAVHAAKALLLERVARGSEPTVTQRMQVHQDAITAADLRRLILRHLEQARALLPTVPRAAWPAFLPLALVPLRLAKLDIFTNGQQADVPQWRRQWALWRAARLRRL